MLHPAFSLLAIAALLPLSMTACASPVAGADGKTGSGANIANGTPFIMQVGQSVTLSDSSRLRYVRMVNDSRCPPDVRCVWAGDAIVAFEWTPAQGDATEIKLHSGLAPRSHPIAPGLLTLKSLERGPTYAAELVVEDKAAEDNPGDQKADNGKSTQARP